MTSLPSQNLTAVLFFSITASTNGDEDVPMKIMLPSVHEPI